MGSTPLRLVIVGFTVVACAILSILLAHKTLVPETRDFHVRARQYAYEPGVINVNKGDTVRIRLSSLDVVHGFYLEGHGIDAEVYPMQPNLRLKDPMQKDGFREVEEIVFLADKVGKFRYRCSHTCGYLHPFMQGEFIVGPNYPFQAGVGATIGVFIAAGFLYFCRLPKSPSPRVQSIASQKVEDE
jgi:heme/copper-type cytochrome/quinol oxidase subunit 2